MRGRGRDERERESQSRREGERHREGREGRALNRGTDYRSITSASMTHVIRPRMIYTNQWMVEQTWVVKERREDS